MRPRASSPPNQEPGALMPGRPRRRWRTDVGGIAPSRPDSPLPPSEGLPGFLPRGIARHRGDDRRVLQPRRDLVHVVAPEPPARLTVMKAIGPPGIKWAHTAVPSDAQLYSHALFAPGSALSALHPLAPGRSTTALMPAQSVRQPLRRLERFVQGNTRQRSSEIDDMPLPIGRMPPVAGPLC